MAKPIPEKNFYRPDEVAAFLDVDLRSVYRWMRTGRIAHVRIGRCIRVPKSEVERLKTRGTSPGC